MEAVAVYLCATPALYHLGARAKLTEPIWSLWSGTGFDRFMNCAACSGFWYGLLVALLGHILGWTFLGAHAWWTIPTVAVCAIVTTPLLAAAHERALHQLAYHEALPKAVIIENRAIDQSEPGEEP